jgi:hypothetical protein
MPVNLAKDNRFCKHSFILKHFITIISFLSLFQFVLDAPPPIPLRYISISNTRVYLCRVSSSNLFYYWSVDYENCLQQHACIDFRVPSDSNNQYCNILSTAQFPVKYGKPSLTQGKHLLNVISYLRCTGITTRPFTCSPFKCYYGL